VNVAKALKSFLTVPLKGDVYTPSHSGLFTPRDKVPNTNWIEGLVGLHCGPVLNERIRTLSCECTYLNLPRCLSPSTIHLTTNKLLVRARNDRCKLVTLQLRISFRTCVFCGSVDVSNQCKNYTVKPAYNATAKDWTFLPLRQITFHTGTWNFLSLGWQIFPLKTGFRYAQVPLKISFNLLEEIRFESKRQIFIFKPLTGMHIKTVFFWNVTPCALVNWKQRS
jgi:hypothetical protein